MYSNVRLGAPKHEINEFVLGFWFNCPPFIVREVACHRTHDEVSHSFISLVPFLTRGIFTLLPDKKNNKKL